MTDDNKKIPNKDDMKKAQSQLDDATEKSKSFKKELSTKNKTPKGLIESSKKFVNSINTIVSQMKNITAEEEEETQKDISTLLQESQKKANNQLRDLQNKCKQSASNKNTKTQNDRLIEYIDSKYNNTLDDIKELENTGILINQLLSSKKIINNKIDTDIDLLHTAIFKNKNHKNTTQRVYQMYDENSNIQSRYINIIKIILIVLLLTLIVVLKKVLIEILRGNIQNKSIFVNPKPQTIVFILLTIGYLSWLFNHHDIYSVSYIMIFVIILFIIYTQWLSIHLMNTPYINLIFLTGPFTILLFFIIEHLPFNNNKINIHKQNTKLAYKINDDNNDKITNPGQPLQELIKDYKTYS